MSARVAAAPSIAPAFGPLCIAAGAVALAVGRDAVALSLPEAQVAVTWGGYGLLLLFTLAAARLAGLDWAELGLDGHHVPLKLSAGLVMGGVLGVPALVHGVSLGVLPVSLPAALAVSVVEELLFRGIIFALLARTLPGAATVAISSIAFAAAHGAHHPPPILLLGLVVGLLLGTWRRVANDLVGPIVAHTIADVAAALAIA